MISAPVNCTNTVSRYGTSSVSYADANQVKFIQAHQIAKNNIAKLTVASAGWPSEMPWCSALAACETAITNTRSNNSSSGVEARCCSCCERARMGVIHLRILIGSPVCSLIVDLFSQNVAPPYDAVAYLRLLKPIRIGFGRAS
jgi:hypothetical protein